MEELREGEREKVKEGWMEEGTFRKIDGKTECTRKIENLSVIERQGLRLRKRKSG